MPAITADAALEASATRGPARDAAALATEQRLNNIREHVAAERSKNDDPGLLTYARLLLEYAKLLLASVADESRVGLSGRALSRNAPPSAPAPAEDRKGLEPGTLAELAFFVALDLWDPLVKVIKDLLPVTTVATAAHRIEGALVKCDEATFRNSEALLLRVLEGLGLQPKVAHDFFSYRNKRAKRSREDDEQASGDNPPSSAPG
jgi:hypothetical protein